MNTLAIRTHTTAALSLVILFWAIAALGVAATQQITVKMVIILAAASAFAVLTRVTIETALFTGVAWAMLSIIAEIVAATNLSQPWFALIGTPAHPLLRDLLLVTWIFAPSLFVRRR